MNDTLQEVGRWPPLAIQTPPAGELVRSMRERIARIEGARRPQEERPFSTGCDALDRLLPVRGFRRGTLVEWISSSDGDGAETLSLLAARQACREGGVLVVLDADRESCFYPPAAARWGIPLEQLLLVQVSQASDYLWALDQSLRSPAVAAVLARIGSPRRIGWGFHLNNKAFRRLQLAVEAGGGLGLFVRPPEALQEPSWADVRLALQPLPQRHVSIRVLAGRAGGSGGKLEVTIDESARTVHLASPMVDPTFVRSAAAECLSSEDRS